MKGFLSGLPDLLKGSLRPERYRERLAMLLYAEEHHEEMTLAEQAVDNAEILSKGDGILQISVPGVREVVEECDKVRLKLSDDSWMKLEVKDMDRDVLFCTVKRLVDEQSQLRP